MAATSRKKAKKQTAKKTAKKTVAGTKSTKKAATSKKPVKKSVKKVAKKTVKKTKTLKKSTGKKAVKKTTKATQRAAVRKKAPARKKPAPRSSKGSGSDELIHGIAPYKARVRESYMNPKQLDHFHTILAAWRKELVNEVNRTIHSMQDETVNHPDPNDRATQESDMSLELRSRDRERKLIKKIDGTIVLIDSGDYGYCEKCGVEVGIARLEARPTATLCVDCKTLDEIREKQMV